MSPPRQFDLRRAPRKAASPEPAVHIPDIQPVPPAQLRTVITRVIMFILGLGVVGGILLVLATSVIGAIEGMHGNTAATGNQSASDLSKQATVQQQNGDLAGAEQSLEQALLKENKADYRSQLAVVKYRLKEYGGSITEYKKLIDAKQDPAFAWNGIGNAYRDWAVSDQAHRTDYQQQAEQAYRQSIALDKGYVSAYVNLAMMLSDEGKTAEAKTVAETGYQATNHAELKSLVDRLQ